MPPGASSPRIAPSAMSRARSKRGQAVDIVERDQRRAARSDLGAQDFERLQHPIRVEIAAARRAAAGAARGQRPGEQHPGPLAGRKPVDRPVGQAARARAMRSIASIRSGSGAGRPSAIRSRAAIGQARSRRRRQEGRAARAPAGDRQARHRLAVDATVPAISSIPASARSRLVLPLPLGPISATSSPAVDDRGRSADRRPANRDVRRLQAVAS